MHPTDSQWNTADAPLTSAHIARRVSASERVGNTADHEKPLIGAQRFGLSESFELDTHGMQYTTKNINLALHLVKKFVYVIWNERLCALCGWDRA